MEKIDETDEGYYVRSGDILEWHWKKGKEPEPPEPVTTETAAAVVPPKSTARKPAAKKATAKAKR